MKNLVRITLFAICVLAFVLQAPDEVQGLKKALKKAKKLKKYAWVLATQRKKFYAIPFPLPLPVFVKRQQIYTQIPIIPRYVHQPQPYGNPAASYSDSSASASSYPQMSAAEMMSLGAGTTQSEVRYPGAAEYYSSSSAPTKRNKKRPQQQQSTSGDYQQFATTALPTSAKYLQQIAAALAQNYQALSGTSSSGGHRDVLSKLLSGQAKVLAPSTLLSSIKSPASSAATTSQQQKTHDELYEQGDQAERDNASSSPSSSPAPGDSSSGPDNGGAHSSETKSSDAAADTKTAASEFYRTLPRPLRIRMSRLAQMQREQQLSLMPINRFAALGAPISPFAAAVAASQMQRIPMLQQPLELQQGNQADELQPEQQEVAASQESEQLAAADGRTMGRQQLDRQRRLLLARQLQLQLQQRGQMGSLAGEQLLAARRRQQQQLYKLALEAREQQEAAAQLAESQAILARAHQLGFLPAENWARASQLLRQSPSSVVQT